MGRGAGLPAAESGVLTHLPVCAAPPGLITSLLPYQMTYLPFLLLPSHAVFLPSWFLPQQRSFLFKLPTAPAHPPCLSWAGWAGLGQACWVVWQRRSCCECHLSALSVRPAFPQRCLQQGGEPGSPHASGSSVSCTCKHHSRNRAFGRQVKDRLTARGLCYLSDSNTRKLNLAHMPLGSPTPDTIWCLLGCSG